MGPVGLEVTSTLRANVLATVPCKGPGGRLGEGKSQSSGMMILVLAAGVEVHSELD